MRSSRPLSLSTAPRVVLPVVVALLAGLLLSLGVAGSAEATGNLSIRTVTKTVATGDTATIKGTVSGARAGTPVVIQQRRGMKDWGSGRTVTTDGNGKWTLDRVIKGKYTRDYRACIGPKNHRTCSLRARIEVVPKGPAIFVTASPVEVGATEPIVVSGATDAALAGAPVALEELNPATGGYVAIAYGIVTPSYTFSVSAVPAFPGKGRLFRITSAATASRGLSTSNVVTSTVFAKYFLNALPTDIGGLDKASVVSRQGAMSFPSSVAPSLSSGLGRIPLGGNCRRLTAQVFLDTNTPDTAAMQTQATTATGAVTNQVFAAGGQTAITVDRDRIPVDVDIRDAQFLTLAAQRSAVATAEQPDVASVWYGDATVTCAF